MSTRRKEHTDCEGNFGPVFVKSGKHKGKYGYYDDDDGEGHAIVYFGSFMDDPYHLIRYSKLERVEAANVEAEVLNRLWPDGR